MSDPNNQSGPIRRLFKQILNLPRGLVSRSRNFLSHTRIRWQNFRRRRVVLEYVILPIAGSYPEMSGPRRSFIERRLPLPPRPTSIQTFQAQIRALSDADNVNGVILYIDELNVSLARIQSLKEGIEKLKAAGKKTVAYVKYPTLGRYYLACAADEIIVPPSSSFNLIIGLFREVLFYRDALEKVGIEFENIQISPYKSAFDTFDKDGMTPEFKAQLDWLLDEQFDMLTQGIADGRNLAQEEVIALFDKTPLELSEAQQYGLIDHLLYEDELERFFFPKPKDGEKKRPKDRMRRLKLVEFNTAIRRLKRKFRPIYRKKGIGVVSLVGGITQGESQQSPIPLPIFGTATAGEKTIVRSLRAAEKMNNLAALIFYVDTRGGDAFASDLIQREVERIGQKIPVIVYMGDVAASGGYYVSAKAKHIICQPATVTGSIGVVSGKPSLLGLYEKAHINAVSIKRGKNAGLYAGSAPLTDEERQILFNSIFESYKEFKWVVADGRDLPFDQLDEICLGKVWTGRQALEHKLVDQNGSFLDAIKKARELSDLPDSEDILVPVYEVYGSRRGRLWPEPFKNEKLPTSIAEWVQSLYRNGQGIQYIMPFEIVDHL